MAVLIDKNTKVICQGLTGSQTIKLIVTALEG